MNTEKLKEWWNEFFKGIFRMNPTFIIVLGLCPTLAITTSIDNAIGMGLITMFVLVFSEILISLMRKLISSEIRIPSYIVIFAAFVTVAELFMKAYTPLLHKSLGIYIPLVVVNCIIYARCEAFAAKNNIFRSILDALGIGIGFTLALSLLGGIRQLLGSGQLSFFGHTFLNVNSFYSPMMLFLLAPGALLTMGLLLAFFSHMSIVSMKWKSKRKIKDTKVQ